MQTRCLGAIILTQELFRHVQAVALTRLHLDTAYTNHVTFELSLVLCMLQLVVSIS